MEIIDPGHMYGMRQLNTNKLQYITFIKRSGGAITYDEEYVGVQVQEVLRTLIDRSKDLNDILPCMETKDAIYHLRMALFHYEARAYRRKMESVNRKSPTHDDSTRPKSWGYEILADIPFNECGIEDLPIGPDGHILTRGDI